MFMTYYSVPISIFKIGQRDFTLPLKSAFFNVAEYKFQIS